jgi:uncharacterized protein YbjT (DUF2867 family)
VKGRAVPKVLFTFGREDELDRDAIRRLVASLSRLLDPAEALAAGTAPGLEFNLVARLRLRLRARSVVYVLTGPQALTHAEIARDLSAALGRTVGHVEASPDGPATALCARGLPSPRTFGEFLAANAQALRTGLVSASA